MKTFSVLARVTTLAMAVTLLGAAPTAAAPAAPAGPVDPLRPGAPGTAELRAPLEGRDRTPARGDTYADGVERRTATLTDRTGPGPTPGQSVRRVAVTQDLARRVVTTTLTYDAAPSGTSVGYVVLGVADGDTCRGQLGIGGSATTADTAGEFAPGSPWSGTVRVTRRLSGTALTLTTAADSRFRAAAWDCAFSYVTVNDATTQQFGGAYLTDHLAPRLSLDPGVPVQGNYRGRWTKIRVDVGNRGRGDATGVRLRASGQQLQVKNPVRSLGTVDDRSTTYGVTFLVRPQGKAAQRRLTLTLTANGGHRAVSRLTVAVKPPPRRVRSLVGGYYWGWRTGDTSTGWANDAVWFVSKRFARVGFPPSGKPACRKASRTCVRYSYDPRTGRVKVGGRKGRVTTEAVTLGGMRYYPLTVPRAGTRIATALVHRNFNGCGVLPYCSTWTRWLSLDRGGRFALTSSSISSIGFPGHGTIYAGSGPDERGRYQVLSNGRIRLAFANGRTQVRTFGIQRDIRGKASPAGEGVVLGEENFYRD